MILVKFTLTILKFSFLNLLQLPKRQGKQACCARLILISGETSFCWYEGIHGTLLACRHKSYNDYRALKKGTEPG